MHEAGLSTCGCGRGRCEHLVVQEPVQKEEKQLSAATNGNLPWKRRGGATAGGYLSRSLL